MDLVHSGKKEEGEKLKSEESEARKVPFTEEGFIGRRLSQNA